MKDFKLGDTRFQLVGKYKLKSIFVKILVFLLLYSALILAVLFFYNRLIIRRNVEQRLEKDVRLIFMTGSWGSLDSKLIPSISTGLWKAEVGTERKIRSGFTTAGGIQFFHPK